ncbi:Carboxypeptidase S1 B [Fulvia fulva]|nr:Carboxypeptidase S1 B [Fulvia fulva]WPV15825.1 Carboxypeptidase S1 B [Fulvia fulva]WPV31736.1 Carboxypeptidase S1 B [Fulvia fulva]
MDGLSQSSEASSGAFRSIGDYNRPGWLEDLAYLLESGVKVPMAYGDRDFACNWIGGEAVSLAINYTNTNDFHAAGYTALQTNDSYSGGQVRQYGNLSFSRVFQAGHEIPSYQPETSYKIFMRALNNLDIATGLVNVTSGDGIYSSVGTEDTWAIKNDQPEQPLQFCYVLEPTTCTEDQIDSILNGTAVIRHYIVVDKNSTALFPDVVGGSSSNDTNATTSPGSSSNSPSSYTGKATSNKAGPWVAMMNLAGMVIML